MCGITRTKQRSPSNKEKKNTKQFFMERRKYEKYTHKSVQYFFHYLCDTRIEFRFTNFHHLFAKFVFLLDNISARFHFISFFLIINSYTNLRSNASFVSSVYEGRIGSKKNNNKSKLTTKNSTIALKLNQKKKTHDARNFVSSNSANITRHTRMKWHILLAG